MVCTTLRFIVSIACSSIWNKRRTFAVRATLASLFLSLRPRSGTLAPFLKKLLKNEDSRAIFYEKAYFLKRTKGEFLISISYIRPPLPLYDCIRYVLSSENTRKVQSQHLILLEVFSHLALTKNICYDSKEPKHFTTSDPALSPLQKTYKIKDP